MASAPFRTRFPSGSSSRWSYAGVYGKLRQGAPTSPALANLAPINIAAWRGRNQLGAEYTRYADDIAFSGGEAFERCVERFKLRLLHQRGFSVLQDDNAPRRGNTAGLAANQRVNVIRADFDRLKTTLTNCIRLGPESQNRDAHSSFRSHLEGQVGFVEMINPAKGSDCARYLSGSSGNDPTLAVLPSTV